MCKSNFKKQQKNCSAWIRGAVALATEEIEKTGKPSLPPQAVPPLLQKRGSKKLLMDKVHGFEMFRYAQHDKAAEEIEKTNNDYEKELYIASCNRDLH